MSLKSCPFYTIARLLPPDTRTGRAACQEQECALWNPRAGECSFQDTSPAIGRLTAAVQVVGEHLADLDRTLQPR